MSIKTSPVICVSTPSFSKNEALRRALRARFPNSRFNETAGRFSPRQLAAFLRDADGAIIGLEPVGAALLAVCPRLRVVAKYGVGLDNVDQEACRSRGIAVRWTPGVNSLSVAELVIGSMIGLCRNFSRASLELRGGRWKKDGGWELSGKTVGVIGVGNVGKEVIRLLAPFRCRVLANDIADRGAFYRAAGCVEASKNQIFKTADVVTIHTPLTPLTRGLVGRGTLSLMKKTSYLINTARGPIVNQRELKRALKRNMIAGAAIDVYEEEPPRDRELLRLPNLMCTPHIGGNSREAVLAMGMSAIENLDVFFRACEASRP